MLWVAVCAAWCHVLKIVAVDHRDDVRAIWEDVTGRPSSFVPPKMEWSDTLHSTRTAEESP